MVVANNTTETTDSQPQTVVPISTNSNGCIDRRRPRLLSAAAEHVAASFRVLHSWAAEGLTLTAAADVKTSQNAHQSFGW